MDTYIRIGLDIAKSYFQVHALADGGQTLQRKLSRVKVREFFTKIAPTQIGMEACGSAHYWAREFRAMGHDVVLMHPTYIKPYVKRGKNDAVDAAACCEAMSRPDMRFVPVKTSDQQAILMLHKTRELLVKQRTMCVNALRSHLSEFGLVVAKGIGRVDELLHLANDDPYIPPPAKEIVSILARQIDEIDAAIDQLRSQIVSSNSETPVTNLLQSVPGIGPITASMIAAAVADTSVFKTGRDFAAWLGLTPRQNSSGGKTTLGSITKQGNRQIRRLLVLASTSLLRLVSKRVGTFRDWIAQLLSKKPARLVTVAIANKLARTLWAVMTTGEPYRKSMFARA